jgi:ubiquinone/menaquinone biosynthesis C-methylase UbiE
VNPLDDIVRLREEYENRKQRLSGSDVYSWHNPANLFMVQGRQRALLAALKEHGIADLSGLRILEVGCGGGGVLVEFLGFGAAPGDLFGVDLLRDRLYNAHGRLPGSHFYNADGQRLPFPSRSFDLALQFTALSSVLDPNIRQNMCREMLRVLRPSGLVVWYDFWLNPTNPQTRGIRPEEIRGLFPGCRCEFRRITLAPPVTRRLAGVSWGLCLFLERLKFLNTHYLAVIQRDH